MERRLWNGTRWGGQSVLALALLCLLCSAQQEPAPPAAPTETTPAATAPEPVAQPQSGIVTANVLVVRARPAMHYERIGQFSRGDKVTIVGGNADWYEVLVPPDTRAWVAAQYLNAEGAVTAEKVRLHSGPGLVFTSFCMANQGTKLEPLGPPVDGWQQVRAPAAASAWVSRAYVRTVDPEPPPEPKAETAAAPAAPAETKTETAAPAAPVAPAEAKTEAAAAPAAPAEPKTEAAAAPAAPAETKTEAAAPAAPAETKTETAAPAAPAAPAETKAETAAPAAPAETKTEAAAAPVAPAEAKTETPAPAPAPVEPKVEATAVPAETKAETAAPAAPAETKAEAAAAPAAPAADGATLVPTAPAADAPIVMKDGLLLSLKSQASELATHVLCMRVGTTAYPVCYLKSARLDLTEWENREVRVYGRELRLPGWSLAVLHVHSIQVNLGK
jgi:hypothetical protein